MKKLQLPSSYAALSPEEQCAAFGGSEFGDAVGSFFDNLHFNDFFWNGGLISFSFTFVPMLLFRVIKTGAFRLCTAFCFVQITRTAPCSRRRST